MIYILQNLVPILAATVGAFAFGGLYYKLLGPAWQRAARVEATAYDKNGIAKAAPFVVTFVAEAWMAAILAGALILAPVEAGIWVTAFGTAFILWVGFVLPTTVVNYVQPGRSAKLMAIDLGHWLAVLMIMAGILRLIGVEGPR